MYNLSGVIAKVFRARGAERPGKAKRGERTGRGALECRATG